MVARITHGRHIEGVLLYNKLKLDSDKARVLRCHNLPLASYGGKISTRKLAEAFRPWFAHPRSRLRDPVFHVSLNPHPDDKLDDMQLIEIADRYMERMGYGDQPYVVFRHDDIARTHLHVVACRIRPDGRAVDYQDYKRRSKAVTEEIEREFNLIPAEGQHRQEIVAPLRVDYAQSNLKAQLSSVLLNLSERYRFASRGEFSSLLKLFNIWMEECRGEVAGRPYAGIIYGALDEKGQRVGKPIKASRFNHRVGYRALQKEYEKTKQWLRTHSQDLDPTRQAIRMAMQSSRTPEEFAEALRPAAINVVFHRSAEHGDRIFGVTFIDHRNGLVLNGSRLGKEFAANRFQKIFTQPETEKLRPEEFRPQTPIPIIVSEESPERRDTGISFAIPDWNLLGQLLDEAARPDDWEEWQPKPKKKKKRHIIQ
ncbi:MAG: relaxase/mobilization nuclease domain-containing protein [Alistipes sp.]|nr:relaxase/mobilization nuclease domain-containing protein [Alistipes sp.]